MVDELTEKLIKKGLEIPGAAAPQGGGGGLMVNVQNPDGTTSPVPVEVAQFLALDQLLQTQQQILLRLDALHHHQKWGGSSGRQSCLLCQQQQRVAKEMDARAQALATMEAEEAAKENTSDDSTGEVPTPE